MAITKTMRQGGLAVFLAVLASAVVPIAARACDPSTAGPIVLKG
jgi:hypothetical protein